MSTDLFAALSFIFISTFTPGPNNISSAAMGALQGYRHSLSYLQGITMGFLIVMFVCALVATSLLSLFPGLETLLRYIGAGYILYLAYGILKASYAFENATDKPLGFRNGFLLQLLNPKLIVYGLTLFSTFFAPLAAQPYLLFASVVLLTFISFGSISVWTLFGTVIRRYFRSPRAKLVLNMALSLFLVYTALELARIL